MPSLGPGARLGTYRVDAVLGHGGMGEVYLAYDTTLHRHVGLKVLVGTGDDSARERLLREARNAAALNHPHICTVYEVGEANGLGFIAMEYVKGRSLRDLMDSGALPVADVLRWGAQAAEALAYAHGHGVIHRDFKAANVIVGDDGRAKIVDFGLARRDLSSLADATTMATVAPAGAIAGTPYAMAPEQVRGEACDNRTDVWALGVLLYEMASGTRPFDGTSSADLFSAILRDPPRALPSSVPAALTAIIDRCLEKTPERRYQQASDVVGALAAVPTALVARPATVGQKVRGPRWIMASAALIVAAGAIAVVVNWRSGADEPRAAVAAAARPVNQTAYDLYLSGLSHAHRRSEADLKQAITLFEQVAALEGTFLPVHAQLALAYTNMSNDFAPTDPTWEERAFIATRKALELDPRSAEAHYARSLLLWRPSQGFPAREALTDLEQAIAARPDFEEALHHRATIRLPVGRHEAARHDLERVLQINPGFTIARFRLAPISNYEQNFEEAIAILNRVPKETYPSQRIYQMAWAFISLGRLDEASQLLDEALRDNPVDQGGVMHAARAMLHAKRGNRRAAEADMAEAERLGRGFIHFHHTAYSIGAVMAVLGDLASAERWVVRASNDGFPNHPFFEADVHLASLRERPSFKTFLTKLRQEWAEIPGVAN
jgi:tetratricopeptide (TPR) repeat protein/predicted Ser/Thr protein kinase